MICQCWGTAIREFRYDNGYFHTIISVARDGTIVDIVKVYVPIDKQKLKCSIKGMPLIMRGNLKRDNGGLCIVVDDIDMCVAYIEDSDILNNNWKE